MGTFHPFLFQYSVGVLDSQLFFYLFKKRSVMGNKLLRYSKMCVCALLFLSMIHVGQAKDAIYSTAHGYVGDPISHGINNTEAVHEYIQHLKNQGQDKPLLHSSPDLRKALEDGELKHTFTIKNKRIELNASSPLTRKQLLDKIQESMPLGDFAVDVENIFSEDYFMSTFELDNAELDALTATFKIRMLEKKLEALEKEKAAIKKEIQSLKEGLLE